MFIRILCFVCFISFTFVNAFLTIKQLDVPPSVQFGSTEELVLDCNFVADKNESNIVLKWYYNDESIYQWIPDSKRHGSGMGKFAKDRLDLEYNVSDDLNTMYRALKIRNVTWDLTGNYTCKVSSFSNEKSETKQLIIYSPAKSELDMFMLENHLVICTVSGIYPEPIVNLYITGENDTAVDIEEEIEVDKDGDGFYNVTTSHYFNISNLTSSTKFVCDLRIPGTNYNLKKTVEYISEIDKTLEEYRSNFTGDSFDDFKDNSGANYFPTSYLQQSLSLIIILIMAK